MKKPHAEGVLTYDSVLTRQEGLGPVSAGQSGDTQRLPDDAESEAMGGAEFHPG